MRLLATSDLHISHAPNRAALERMAHYPDDWLIVAGDIGEKPDHLRAALDQLVPRFAKIIWTPGNHDLWCPPDATDRTRGQARYDELVAICRSYGTLTPEDPYAEFPHAGSEDPASDRSAPVYLCPMFLLYDYSFRPPEISREGALPWARESGVVCGDEQMLDPQPWPSREAWCHARCDSTEARLMALPEHAETVLINHWPLRYDLARPPRVPRFSIWCGTTRTELWPRRFRARAVVNGHLHMRTTIVRHGIRHEEVSLGYPRDWNQDRGIDWYLREILPGTSTQASRFVPARDPFMMLAQ
jgi:3',5'-cyclic AMP phosphodiesterase CpdA